MKVVGRDRDAPSTMTLADPRVGPYEATQANAKPLAESVARRPAVVAYRSRPPEYAAERYVLHVPAYEMRVEVSW